jgi:hypothetical protein
MSMEETNNSNMGKAKDNDDGSVTHTNSSQVTLQHREKHMS